MKRYFIILRNSEYKKKPMAMLLQEGECFIKTFTSKKKALEYAEKYCCLYGRKNDVMQAYLMDFNLCAEKGTVIADV